MASLSCHIDDFGPLPVERPASVAELGDLIRRSAAEGRALYPVGGGTLLGLGLPPTRPGVAVDVRGLDQVIDYPARDMTVTVQAGITLARLAERLAAEKLRLPLDVPAPDRATLGGALATNASGPRRFGCGTLRDYVIGISAVNDEGAEVKAGGRVVKNVAGYDLCKLHVGALGTLGVLTQVTLKLKPLPEEHALIGIGCDDAAVEPLLDQLHQSRCRPVCVELLNRAALRAVHPAAEGGLLDTAWAVVVGFEDNREAVSWQVQQFIKEVPANLARPIDIHAGAPAAPLWAALAEFPLRPQARLSFKANLLPHATAAFCRDAVGAGDGLLLQAHAGNGVVVGHLEGDWTVNTARALLNRLQDLAAAAQGQVIVTHCPAAWKAALPVWGRPRGDHWLMRTVKDKFDPNRLFNPGRYVADI